MFCQLLLCFSAMSRKSSNNSFASSAERNIERNDIALLNIAFLIPIFYLFEKFSV